MSKFINFNLAHDEQLQHDAELKRSRQSANRLALNLDAFSHHIPSLYQLFHQHQCQQFSLFVNKRQQFDLVDFAEGRVIYGLDADIAAEVTSFLAKAPVVYLNDNPHKYQSTLSGRIEYTAVPDSPDVIVMFGLGLGNALVELLHRVKPKYVLVYEPELDFFSTSVYVADWRGLLEHCANIGCQLFLQMGDNAHSLPEDLRELLALDPSISTAYFYRHYFDPVMDDVFMRHVRYSADYGQLVPKGVLFAGFKAFDDFIEQRSGCPLANQDWTLVADDDAAQQLFTQNLATFRRLYPSIADNFAKYQPKRWQLVRLRSGNTALWHAERGALFQSPSTTQTEQAVEHFIKAPFQHTVVDGFARVWKFRHYIHNQFNDKFLELFQRYQKSQLQLPEQVESLIFFGIGHADHIAQMHARREIRYLYLCEPNQDFFYASLYRFDWTALLASWEQRSGRVYLNVGDDGSNYVTDFMDQFYVVGPYALADTYLYQSYFHQGLQQAIRKLTADLKVMLAAGENFDHARYGIVHTLTGIKQGYPYMRSDRSLRQFPLLQQVPVIVVGNGPSLDGLIPTLKAIADQAIIVSCGTALRALHKYGIKPDLHAEIEQNRSTFDWITQVPDAAYLKDIVLISNNGIHPDSAALFKEVWLAFKRGESATVIFRDLLDAGPFSQLEFCYPTVSNLVLNFCTAAGFKYFYLFGVDLGFKDPMRHHSAASSYYNVNNQQIYDYQRVHGDAHPIRGNFAPVVYTKHEFDFSRKVITQTIKAHPGIEVYNCSDGALIEGTRPLLPDHILLSADLDKKACLAALAECFTGLPDQVLSKFELLASRAEIEQCRDALLALLEQPVANKTEALALVRKQWDLVAALGRQRRVLFFYLFFGSSNYVSGVLTKFASACTSDGDADLTLFHEAIALWRQYLMQAVDSYLEQPLQLDCTEAGLPKG